MCGIVSIIAKEKGKLNYKLRTVFETMLFIDTLRGKDSTGIYSVNVHGNVDWAKEASTAQEFLASPDVSKILSNIAWDTRALS